VANYIIILTRQILTGPSVNQITSSRKHRPRTAADKL